MYRCRIFPSEPHPHGTDTWTDCALILIDHNRGPEECTLRVRGGAKRMLHHIIIRKEVQSIVERRRF